MNAFRRFVLVAGRIGWAIILLIVVVVVLVLITGR